MADSLRYKKASEVLSTMTDYVLTHTNKVNDFTEGSAIETLLEASSLYKTLRLVSKTVLCRRLGSLENKLPTHMVQ
mgnify:CR=1 FL=1